MSFYPGVIKVAGGTEVSGITVDGFTYLFAHSMPKGWAIAHGDLPNHASYRAFGYDGAIPTSITDVSGRSLNVNLPATATAMEVVSSSANDAGTTVTSGTSTGGSTTTLIDTGKNFVALGVSATTDYVLNDTDVVLGKITSVDSATQVTFVPTSLTTFAGKTYRIVRAASTGVAVIEHHGLDDNYLDNSEFVVMNGVTPVTLAKSYLRSNNFHGMVAGSNGAPVGNISLRDDATGTITYNYIQAGLNMSLQCHVTVPANKVMHVPSWHAGSSGNKPIKAFLRGTSDFDDRAYIPGGLFHVQDVIVTNNADQQHKFDLPIKFPSKCDVKISAAVIGAGTGEVGCGFEYYFGPT